MQKTIVSFDETPTTPKVDLVRGHIAFSEMAYLLIEKYGNPEFADCNIRYEYAVITERAVEVAIPDPETGEPTDATELQDSFRVALNCKPDKGNAEPVTVLYFENFALPKLKVKIC